MSKAGFEPEITASERSKTVHVSDHSATATDILILLYEYSFIMYICYVFRSSWIIIRQFS
jgi:hypothetical protein